MKFRIYGSAYVDDNGENESYYHEVHFKTSTDCYDYLVKKEFFILGDDGGFVVQGFYEVKE